MANSDFKTPSGSDIKPKQHFLVMGVAETSGDPVDLELKKLPALKPSGPGYELGDFKAISGIEMDTEVIEWKCGNYNSMLKLPGITKFPIITLSKGFDSSSILSRLFKLVWNYSDGASAIYKLGYILIQVYNRDFNTANQIPFRTIRINYPWVSKYIADDLDGQSSDPWLEKVEIAHNGWEYTDQDGNSLT